MFDTQPTSCLLKFPMITQWRRFRHSCIVVLFECGRQQFKTQIAFKIHLHSCRKALKGVTDFILRLILFWFQTNLSRRFLMTLLNNVVSLQLHKCDVATYLKEVKGHLLKSCPCVFLQDLTQSESSPCGVLFLAARTHPTYTRTFEETNYFSAQMVVQVLLG